VVYEGKQKTPEIPIYAVYLLFLLACSLCTTQPQ